MADPNAPAAVAESIRSLLHDRERMARMGAEGRAAVERKYSWDAVASQLAAIFENQIGK
jgi:glycosyltransferase involved in cell wall biosynthesis